MGVTREQRLRNLRSALADAQRRHAPRKHILDEIRRITTNKLKAELRDERNAERMIRAGVDRGRR